MPDALPPSLHDELRDVLGDRLLVDDASLFVYECDALTQFKRRPLAVTLPESTRDVQAIARACHAAKVSMTPRGAGTGLSGGALPAETGGVLIDTSRMRRILEIDVVDRFAVVEPGLVNLHLSQAVTEHGLFYAPDPSSQMTCTIGGNIAENSGGPHCLKYGATTNHVLGVSIVLANGDLIELGGPEGDGEGLDLLGAFVGSEGTLGIVTRATLRLSPKPAVVATLLAGFTTMPEASRAVADVIAAGITPAAIEALDDRTIAAVEASVFAAGYPSETGAVLLVELDGHELDVAADRTDIEAICRRHECVSFEAADDPARRAKLWQGRKGAFGAMGRVAPDLYVMDAVVPRSRLEEAIRKITEICDRHDVYVANVFHAGEGNLHPNISYDGRDADEVRRVLAAGEEIVRACLDLGGALSGEHGIGLEKQEFMPLAFTDADLDAMERFRDAWNPSGLLNPDKILPTPRACVEVRGAASRKPSEIVS